ncbi:hypothetical protein BU25DRAFT_461825 [Macroventuria anomochaeta]|uniref:Uncharacterized protein n=1 Tax=Macroventuria anomochaeta TaxID=301207 RepID=A0ACB6RPS9_9PLEO|nr:uncharacterized protein BU25DRAFT_461825 [Macroventuria anomochaeta]KAF2623743.1 hypothetical protein BU25DRAFT_461825 [Macroventuria anomochaeta]
MRFSTLSFLAGLIASAISQNVPNVLIFGWAGSKEDQAATQLGYNTTIVTESEWANMTTLDFARYDAVVVPDLNTDYITSLKFLEDSKDAWSPAITGSMIIIGGDPVNHFSTGGASTLISNAIRFATVGHSSQETTGLYLALSRCYNNVNVTTVDALSYFGTFTIRGGLSCYDKAHLVASSPALDSLSDAALSNWGCSVHEAFSLFPTTGLKGFQALAIAQDVLGEGSQRFGDGSVGLPYIISHGATPAACGDGLWDELYGEECDDSNTLDGDGCSSSCKCESGIPNGDGTCFDPPISSAYLPPPSYSTQPYGPYPTESYGPLPSYSNYGAAPATTLTSSYAMYRRRSS